MRGDAFRLFGLGLTAGSLAFVPGCLAKFDKDYPVTDRNVDGGAAGVAATGTGGEVGTAGAQTTGGVAGAMTPGAGGTAAGEGGTAP